MKGNGKPIRQARADMIADFASFSRTDFVTKIEATLVDSGASPHAHDVLVSMLADQIQTYIKCCEEIEEKGLVVDYPNGVSGRNHHVAIREKAASIALGILNELCLTPKSIKKMSQSTPEKFEKFMLGPSTRLNQ
jgi:phage terminase small subunit